MRVLRAAILVLALLGFACLLARALVGCSTPPGASTVPGQFSQAYVDVRMDGGGRSATLLHDFSFTDGRGKVWACPKGSVTDGASIPRELWTLVGGPYEGQYRFAAFVHDAYCHSRTEPWREVHRMFYEACLAAGCGEQQAKVLYAGVFHFGPRWGLPTTGPIPMEARAIRLQKPMEEIKAEVEARPGITLEEIERL